MCLKAIMGEQKLKQATADLKEAAKDISDKEGELERVCEWVSLGCCGPCS
jgi:hypothetical protein